jgi:hypothetical protein
MKLYTEEQVKILFRKKTLIREVTIESMFQDLKSIELPSDEDIEESSPIINANSHDYYVGHKDGFIEGAKWMRDKLTKTKDK